jgi:hypothetical protein
MTMSTRFKYVIELLQWTPSWLINWARMISSKSTNSSEPVWLEPLRGLLAVVCSPQPGKEALASLMTSLAEVETLLAQHRAEMPPDLVHFLERRSYDKAARLCAGSMAIPRGTCGTKS